MVSRTKKTPKTSLRVLSTIAVMTVLRELTPRFEEETGIGLDVDFATSRTLVGRIRDGETGDVAILGDDSIVALTTEDLLVSWSKVDLARSVIGLGVRAGSVKPDISSVAAFTKTLLNARSIAYSGAGISGLFFSGLIERLGLAEQVVPKATIIPSGFTGELVANGRVELAVQQISELMSVPGVDIVGALPTEIQSVTIFSAGLFCEAQLNAAKTLTAFLGSAAAAQTYLKHGLEPVSHEHS